MLPVVSKTLHSKLLPSLVSTRYKARYILSRWWCEKFAPGLDLQQNVYAIHEQDGLRDPARLLLFPEVKDREALERGRSASCFLTPGQLRTKVRVGTKSMSLREKIGDYCHPLHLSLPRPSEDFLKTTALDYALKFVRGSSDTPSECVCTREVLHQLECWLLECSEPALFAEREWSQTMWKPDGSTPSPELLIKELNATVGSAHSFVPSKGFKCTATPARVVSIYMLSIQMPFALYRRCQRDAERPPKDDQSYRKALSDEVRSGVAILCPEETIPDWSAAFSTLLLYVSRFWNPSHFTRRNKCFSTIADALTQSRNMTLLRLTYPSHRANEPDLSGELFAACARHKWESGFLWLWQQHLKHHTDNFTYGGVFSESPDDDELRGWGILTREHALRPLTHQGTWASRLRRAMDACMHSVANQSWTEGKASPPLISDPYSDLCGAGSNFDEGPCSTSLRSPTEQSFVPIPRRVYGDGRQPWSLTCFEEILPPFARACYSTFNFLIGLHHDPKSKHADGLEPEQRARADVALMVRREAPLILALAVRNGSDRIVACMLDAGFVPEMATLALLHSV